MTDHIPNAGIEWPIESAENEGMPPNPRIPVTPDLSAATRADPKGTDQPPGIPAA